MEIQNMPAPQKQSQTFFEYDNDEMNEIVNRLVQVYDPISIYLFGSYAWGMPNKDSDYDLCVIVENCEPNLNQRSLKGYKALMTMKKRKPVDIVVYSAKKFKLAATRPATFASTINNKGILLYDRTIQRTTIQSK
ncbi:MAG: nucleotidyltransferase domain-containing protein [Planctomycetaceae bacterium]|jgi:predicted nucleotidyltransferase|nr:nucleotidyltransferase domain-containing protein [Planctomycetaceae bacterium]